VALREDVGRSPSALSSGQVSQRGGRCIHPPCATASCAGRYRGAEEPAVPRPVLHVIATIGIPLDTTEDGLDWGLIEGETDMARKQVYDRMSISIPRGKLERQPIERLVRLGEQRDRSLNYLVVEAIFDYLEREESKN